MEIVALDSDASFGQRSHKSAVSKVLGFKVVIQNKKGKELLDTLLRGESFVDGYKAAQDTESTLTGVGGPVKAQEVVMKEELRAILIDKRGGFAGPRLIIIWQESHLSEGLVEGCFSGLASWFTEGGDQL